VTVNGEAMKTPFLIGDRIYLRALEPEDAPALKQFISDPEVTRTLMAYRPYTIAQELEFIERATKQDNDIVLGIATKSEDKLIGTTGLHRIDWRDRRTEFGILIGAKDEWNKGYGTDATRTIVRYAFETLNLNRVGLRVYEHNPRAMRAYEKAGFRKEGVLRQEAFREGRYWDTIIMGVLRNDWAGQTGR